MAEEMDGEVDGEMNGRIKRWMDRGETDGSTMSGELDYRSLLLTTVL